MTPPVAHTPAPAPSPYSAPAAAPAPRPSDAGKAIVVELGTRSSSNFYKGLSGNDVVEHGGIFVATYKIPPLGSSVKLHVLLPGNYEFRATATVQWVREPRGDGDPGFGARFSEITPDGRQLVYRYAKNREPLFYDDL
ncbi:MAG: PilZ domain-containing protein [Polyangiaceae bacterium]